jgi:hypothetical protein
MDGQWTWMNQRMDQSMNQWTNGRANEKSNWQHMTQLIVPNPVMIASRFEIRY